eukprot:m.71018 g.71018  ORF g.71018 m.71018 type:complete len:93 (+) comp8680_c0_seq1:203-481(+)
MMSNPNPNHPASSLASLSLPAPAARADESQADAPLEPAPPRCAWKDSISLCDGCRSTCAMCTECTDSKKDDCAWCWDGFAPCLPLCTDSKCF